MSYLYKEKKFTYVNKGHREFDQFFVWKNKSIYIMDNHRAALWCWLKEIDIDLRSKVSLIHIDNHPDMSPRGLHCTCARQINFKNLTIKDYLQEQHICNGITGYTTNKVFSYDNFLRFFIEQYPSVISPKDVYVTLPQGKYNHKVDKRTQRILKKYMGEIKTFISDDCYNKVQKIDQEELLSKFNSDKKSNWIIDLDLDYFFNEETKKLNINLATQVFQQIKNWYDQNKIIVLTVAWSPEFLIDREKDTVQTGLKRANDLNKEFCKVFNLNLNLFEK